MQLLPDNKSTRHTGCAIAPNIAAGLAWLAFSKGGNWLAVHRSGASAKECTMSTARTMIRPRTRGESLQPRTASFSTDESIAIQAPHADDESPLPVLMRLPEVAIPSSAKLSLRLDWLAKLDWNRIRRVKLDPNWVAGGLLGLVLFLLIMITLNRSSKPDPNTSAPNEAPSWNAGNLKPSPTSAAGVSASTSAHGMGPVTDRTDTSNGQTLGAGMSQTAASNAQQYSLEGISYPQTPHDMPAGMALEARTQITYGQPTGESGFDNGIRTAQRDTLVPRAVQAPTNPAHPGHAQFEGYITKPTEIRR